MDQLFQPQFLAPAAYIFGLRVVEMSLDTLRVLSVVRGRRAVAWVFGFFQSLLFVLAITSVLANLDNLLTAFGYAAGFATGSVLGIFIEEWLAFGHIHMRVISARRGSEIADQLRQSGFAVTEIPGRGRDGTVTLINANVLRRQVPLVERIASAVDEQAFITAEDVQPVRRGFWRA